MLCHDSPDNGPPRREKTHWPGTQLTEAGRDKLRNIKCHPSEPRVYFQCHPDHKPPSEAFSGKPRPLSILRSAFLQLRQSPTTWTQVQSWQLGGRVCWHWFVFLRSAVRTGVSGAGSPSEKQSSPYFTAIFNVFPNSTSIITWTSYVWFDILNTYIRVNDRNKFILTMMAYVALFGDCVKWWHERRICGGFYFAFVIKRFFFYFRNIIRFINMITLSIAVFIYFFTNIMIPYTN